MAEAPEPLLAYDRIEANRRNTGLLLAAFVVLLTPVGYVLSRYVLPALVFFFRQLTEGQITVLAVLLAVALTIGIACMEYFWTPDFLLHRLQARKLGPQDDPDFRRTVENLCIGAGLPQPRLYIVESSTPNSFAVGRDPQHASLTVTRGLLALLDRRELEGVIAHELSHIGNQDTQLSTVLATLIGTLGFPFRVGTRICRFLYPDSLRSFARLVAVVVLGPLLYFLEAGFVGGRYRLWQHPFVALLMLPWLILWGIARHPWAAALLVYIIFGVPLLATLLRQIISHEREFLADADAVLLTRDPEGLALALTKVSAATGAGMRAGAATAHLYFVDPLPQDASWWDSLFPSHPRIVERIDLLSKMGNEIAPAALLDAVRAADKYETEAETRRVAEDLAMDSTPLFGPETPRGAELRLTAPETLLYREPNGSAAVLANLDQGSVVTYVGTEQNFARVQTADAVVGYIPRFGRIHRPPRHSLSEQMLPGTAFRLTDETPLYEEPDGWSQVLEYLPANTIVTFNELTGNFVRVAVDHTSGYISSSVWAESILGHGDTNPTGTLH